MNSGDHWCTAIQGCLMRISAFIPEPLGSPLQEPGSPRGLESPPQEIEAPVAGWGWDMPRKHQLGRICFCGSQGLSGSSCDHLTATGQLSN